MHVYNPSAWEAEIVPSTQEDCKFQTSMRSIYSEALSQNTRNKPVVVMHACNLSYSGGKRQVYFKF
jgi:hypothetical protein